MTEGREHSWYEELIPAYALGLADESEHQAVEAHLVLCPPCRARAAEYAELTTDLLFATPPVEARAGLTEDLRMRLRTSAKPAARKPWTALMRPGFVLAIAALALLVLTNIYWAGRATRAERDVETLARLTQAPGILLNVPSDDSYASGIVYTEPAANLALLCVYDLPVLEPGKTYQAWLGRGDDRVSGGTFRVDESGYGVLLIQSDTPLGTYDGLGITVEPEGGSPAPTTPRVMGGSL